MPTLFHVSEEAGIRCFEPRTDTDGQPRVWAITDARLHNYLLPRDCPRVTFYGLAGTTVADRRRFLGQADSVVCIEQGWEARALSTALSVYELPADTFELKDATAGYYTSDHSIIPVGETRLRDPLAAIVSRQPPAEIRMLSDLWELREAVAGSTLGFSIIRFRNAAPAPHGFQTHYPLPPAGSDPERNL
jgi:hypothetical protein